MIDPTSDAAADDLRERLRGFVEVTRGEGHRAPAYLAAMSAILDDVFGPLEGVIHTTGPVIEGGQLCGRCGTVLQDLYGKHIAILDDDAPGPHSDDARLRMDRGWDKGTMIFELWRWGEAISFPRTLGIQRTEPDPTQGERFCEAST